MKISSHARRREDIAKNLSDQLWSRIEPLEGWCSRDKANVLYQLSSGVCVEVGVFGGKSLLPIAFGVRSHGGHVIGVDCWSNAVCTEEAPTDTDKEWWQSVDLAQILIGCKAALIENGLGNIVTLIVATSEGASSSVDSCDLLHLDASHSEDATKRDMDLWVPKVVPGGAVVIDDVEWPGTQNNLPHLRKTCDFVREVDGAHVYRKL